MSTAAARRETDEGWNQFRVPSANQTEPLSECVRIALRFYLAHLGDYEANDLHAMVLAEVERPLLETVLEHTHGNQTQAARLLGLSRSTLRKKMADYGVRPPE